MKRKMILIVLIMKTSKTYLFNLIIFSIIISLLIASCSDKDCHEMIRIVNNTNKDIYYIRSPYYHDTSSISYFNPNIDPSTYKVLRNSDKMDHFWDCLEKEKSGTVFMYYIFDAKVLDTTSWDSIVKHYQILKRYDLTINNLKATNWTITYP